MTPAITAVRMTGAAHRAELPLLVLGPSLGTSATTLWTEAAAGLTDHFDVLAWDLPGHGHNRSVPDEPITMADLAAGVLTVVDEVQAQRGGPDHRPGAPFAYAGVSVGGCVGLQLLLDAPQRVGSAVLLCTGARIGDESVWADRIGQVQASGTSALVGSAAGRWFAPGFADRDPGTVSGLLHALQDADDLGYVRVCEALAGFDVRDRLGEIDVPLLAVAGADDPVTTVAHLEAIATGVRRGALVELADTSHLAPAERPEDVAALIRRHVLGSDDPDAAEEISPGMKVRREVLGDEHVDRAIAGTTEFTRDFQELITDYAWGGIWTRPGLDRRSRSIITLTALIARGHHEELAMHLRAAVRNGLTHDEIKEILLQTAVYCGVPDANTAFRIAQQVFED
ncbi:bifunctional 3-oxoadipate enol-lactonase/4-carboxymuconolactone decarboxylase PcaDC [Nocardioides dilutus]